MCEKKKQKSYLHLKFRVSLIINGHKIKKIAVATTEFRFQLPSYEFLT